MRSIEQEINIFLDNKTEKSIINRLRSEGCVFAEEESQLLVSEARSIEELMDMVEKRVSGLPLEYVLGFTKFCGLRIEVERGVFIPRRRTEFLVQQANVLTRPYDIVLDLCCGSGAVGAAMANLNKLLIYAVDIESSAVKCASRNLTNIDAHVYQGDLYHALPDALIGRVNTIVANVPYVPTDALKLLHREALLYESKRALDGGKSGLDIQRKVAEKAPFWLTPGGHLLVETSEMQASQTSEIFASVGLITKIARDDELDATVVMGRNPVK